MGKHLVIVESPAKAKTLAKFLGPEYIVESSIGHIRDLPSKAAEIPAAQRKKAWSRLGVDIENGFKPLYIVPSEKKKQVKKLKDALEKVDDLYLATDEDREGEAIAWHLLKVLKPKVSVKRMVFHEITKKAIKKALENPRDLDERLVEAQEARRILDRLFGYELSPVLWKKVRPRLSAGRVQSVATRLVVQRELERMAFKVSEYWGVEASLVADGTAVRVAATLVDLAGKRVAIGKDFDGSTGELSPDAVQKGVVKLNEVAAKAIEKALRDETFKVVQVTTKPFSQRPAAPFITSTLQQEAGRKLGFSAQRTMRVAQRLYENGYITYMRTDATTLSDEAINAARSQISKLYGQQYLPDSPRRYQKKVKGAQEAHEAIRPAGDVFRTPDEVRELDKEAHRLYELVWKRTVASQMTDARGQRTKIRFEATLSQSTSLEAGMDVAGQAGFQSSGKTISFPGFLRAYVEGSDDPEMELGDKEVILPKLTEGQALSAEKLTASGHSTKPPARYTEASLVKELEQLGIGRPSTYASTIQTIQDRGYVWKRHGALVPTLTALAVIRLLEKHFEELVDYDFTAKMESDLDAISSGQMNAAPWLKRFYFGERGSGSFKGSDGDAAALPLDQVGIKAKIDQGIEHIDARGICSFELGRLGDDVVAARVGRYGPYIQVGDGDQRASIPDQLPLDELDLERAGQLLSQARDSNRVLGQHPETKETIYLKNGRFGPYVQLGEGKTKGKKRIKPRMVSLWPGMEPAQVTLDDALMLLSYPRVLGVHPEFGSEIVADSGQYGPYLSMEKDGRRETRSLDDHEQLRGITLEKAVELFAQPKKRRARGASRTVLAELGESPVTSKQVQVRTGRFGPYVTDGQVNASLPSGQEPTNVSLDYALDLIAAREEKLQAQGKDPRAPKKATAKSRSGVKKGTKKKAGKKIAKKKSAKSKARKKTTTKKE